MPIGGTRQTRQMGQSYSKDPIYSYAKAFYETAQNILTENTLDVFEEPTKVLRRPGSRDTMKNFFMQNAYDEANTMLSPEEKEDMVNCLEAQFENDVEAMYEHAVLPEYNPIVGMALPIHKLILMNMVFDKGGIQKVTAVQPKFTISLERRILVTPTGEEIDMFTEQNKMTDAINSTAPVTTVTLTLPEVETTDVVAACGGTAGVDNLSINTVISAVKIEDVYFETGDVLPNTDGYIVPGGTVATDSTKGEYDVWFKVNIPFAPNYGGPNRYERIVMRPIKFTVKKQITTGEGEGATTSIQTVTVTDTISASMNKNKFNVMAINNKVTAVRLSSRLDASSGMLDTCSVKWKVDTDLIEIDTAIPVNTTISPEEVKDLAAMYNVNQLTKLMGMVKTVLANYKDDSIKKELDDDYDRLDARCKTYNTFDFAPREGYALDHVEYRHKTFFDFLDSEVTKLLQVLNDPNMTVSIYGDPEIVRKITPKEYTYQAPSNIGPVELDYTQTVVNASDKRVYQFFGSDKMRNTDELMILLNPRNTDRVIYRIYDYQMYVSNEIRNAANPSLPALHAFERWKFVSYQGVQGRVKILNRSGLNPA